MPNFTSLLVYDSDVEPDNLTPLDELERLRIQIAQASELDQLKPAFYRVEELIKQHSSDFDIQLAANEIKQRIVNRGVELKQSAATQFESGPIPQEAPVRPPFTPQPDSQPFNTPVPVDISKPIQAAPPLSPSIGVRGPALPPDLLSAGITSGIPPRPVPTNFHQTGSRPESAITNLDQPLEAATSNGGGRKKLGIWIGAIVVLAAGAFSFAGLRRSNASKAAQQAIQPMTVQFSTQPTGAAILIDGTPRCVADCSAALAPGTYTAIAMLDGYESQTYPFRLDPGQPRQLSVTLQPLPQTIRIFADEPQSAPPATGKGNAKTAAVTVGKVLLDEAVAGNLAEGQMVIEHVAPGDHKLQIINGSTDLTFHVSLTPGKQPLITGDMVARNTTAILVGSFLKQARITTSTGPLKVALNGQPQPDATPTGVDLEGFQTGESEIAVGTGSTQRTFKEIFAPGPTLTVFLKSESNAGMLTINTGQNDVRVFINDKEFPRRTQYGQVRVAMLGPVSVRVQKNGYDDPPAQQTVVVKGSAARLNFKLTPLPEFSSLQITGGTPGAEVLLDQRVVGSLGPDGAFRNSSISPGQHLIQFRRDQFEPKQFTRTVPAGQPLSISGADATLTPIRVAVVPPRAPEPKPVALPPPPPPKPIVPVAKPQPRSGTIANFDVPGAWRDEDNIFRHRGAATLTYGILPANGVFTFTIHLLKGGTVFRGGRVRWFIDYIDAKNYGLYELDDDTLYLRVMENGKILDRGKVPVKIAKGQKRWPLQVDIAADRVIVRLQKDGTWQDLDTWSEPGRNFPAGKFGILVSGDDEVGLSEFRFQGR
ncbi:MAG: hypothetical protein ABI824_05885 [Acidobacteriota bacterium]